MKLFLLVLALSMISCNGSNGSSYPSLPNNISKYPDEISVKTIGSSASNVEYTEDDSLPYVWEHTVSIASEKQHPVQIVEFGSFILDDNEWFSTTHDGKPYDANLFEKWFDCPNAILEPNQTYTSDKFRNIGDVIPKNPRIICWYFIGLSGTEKIRGEIHLIDKVD